MGKRDDLILRIDNCLMSMSNAIAFVNPLCYFPNFTSRNVELIDSSRDICFVIGNGPSLSQKDLDLIKNYDAINVNYFYEGDKSFSGKYLVFIDPSFATEKGIDYVKKCLTINPEMIILTSKNIYQYIRSKIPICDKQLYCINLCLKQHGDGIKTKINKPMTGGQNIMPVAIELAIGLGYKRIYLLGCDFSFYGVSNAGKHFYDNDDYKIHESYNTVGNLIRCALVQQHHFAILKECNKREIEILNLTPGSLIMAYRLADINEIGLNKQQK